MKTNLYYYSILALSGILALFVYSVPPISQHSFYVVGIIAILLSLFLGGYTRKFANSSITKKITYTVFGGFLYFFGWAYLGVLFSSFFLGKILIILLYFIVLLQYIDNLFSKRDLK